MPTYHDLKVTIELDELVQVLVSEFTVVKPDPFACNPDDFWGYEEAEFTFANGKYSDDYDADCSDIHQMVVDACKEEVAQL